MNAYRITNQTSGHCLGTYEAETDSEALEEMARDAGYTDYKEAQSVAPESRPLLVEEVDPFLWWKRPENEAGA